MARHGIPERAVSDNGPQYSSEEFCNFARQYELEHVTSSPGYPESNGKAESAIKQAKRIMENAITTKADPYLVLLEHRNTPSDLLLNDSLAGGQEPDSQPPHDCLILLVEPRLQEKS